MKVKRKLYTKEKRNKFNYLIFGDSRMVAPITHWVREILTKLSIAKSVRGR